MPTSHYLADKYYQDAEIISENILTFLGRYNDADAIHSKFKTNDLMDVPSKEFHGPF